MFLKGQKTVVLFASAVALLVLIAGYFVPRDGLVDEAGFLNPPYVMAHYGKLTFPAYSYGAFFNVPVVTHPPIHVGWIGLLWRLGMHPYYAEATPTVLLFFAAILIIVFSAFPLPVKLGWLFSIGFLATSGETMTLCFGTRPEGELLAAWLCGLLLLESGRLDHWNRGRLFAGSLFLTWASGTHYYAGPAFLGVVVYLIWAVRTLGWKHSKPALVAIVAGGVLFALPYLALYVVPYYRDIRAAIQGNQGPGGVGLSIERHMALYRVWVTHVDRPLLIRTAMRLGIPLFVLSTALLAAVPSTRGIALAALPLQLGLFFFAWHKMPYYFVHECVLFAGAFAVAVLAVCDRLVKLYVPGAQRMFGPVAAAILAVCLFSGSPTLAHAEISAQPRFHEIEVAQAAGIRMMGPHARIGGRWWAWHSAGAEHWYDVEHDLMLNATAFDPDTYLSNMDALAVCYEVGSNDYRIYDWFAQGKLKLRGFFIGQTGAAMRCVQLSAQNHTPLTGYVEWNDQLYRFEEDPRGDHEVLTTVCPVRGDEDLGNPSAGIFSVAFRLPDNPSRPPEWIITAVGPRRALSPEGQAGQGCREISRISGSLVREDRRALVESWRRNEAPIHFYKGVQELPGYKGVGLPPDVVAPPDATPVPGTIDLSAAAPLNGAIIDRTNGVHLTTIPAAGGFSAMIPVKNAENVKGPCWVVLTIHVTEGRVGFGPAAEGGTLLAHTLGFAPSPEPQTVALKVANFQTARNIIIFNQSNFRGQVDVLDAAVLIPRAADGRDK